MFADGQVGRAFMVLAMILFGFSVIGLQLWKDGLMRSRCTNGSGGHTSYTAHLKPDTS